MISEIFRIHLAPFCDGHSLPSYLLFVPFNWSVLKGDILVLSGWLNLCSGSKSPAYMYLNFRTKSYLKAKKNVINECANHVVSTMKFSCLIIDSVLTF